MRQVSGRWADALASNHEVLIEVSHIGTGEVLPLDTGSVTLDITAATRGRCDLSFSDPRLIPVNADSILAPYGRSKLGVKRGLRYPDGETELVELGAFRVEETEVSDTSDGAPSIRVSGLDGSAKVIDAAFEEPFQIPSGSDYLEAIRDGILVVDPTASFDFAERALETTTLKAEEGDDRWAFYQAMASALGMDLYYDNAGVVVLRPIASPDAAPVISIVEGRAGVSVKPLLLSASKKWSRVDAHNKWIVVGDNPDIDGAPPRGVAVDDDPESPTYYDGPFGKKPEFYSSAFIATDEQANDAAQGKKSKESGISQSVDFGSLVNPALEPGDVGRVTRTYIDPLKPDEVIPIADENHIIDSLTIPLSAGESMTGITRASKVKV